MHGDVRTGLRTALRTAFVAPILCCLLLTAGLFLNASISPAGRILAVATMAATVAALVRLVVCVRRTNRMLDEIERDIHDQARRLTRDEGTGALLRRFFLEACERRLEKSEGMPMAYLAIDMDFLKQLNDSLGHEAGDAALRHLVGVIRVNFPDGLVGRLGGDEFGLFLPCASEAEMEAIAGRLLENLTRPFAFGGRSLVLSATVGVSLLPQHTRFMSEAVQFSDLALYEGKKLGRNRFTVFDRRMLGDFRHDRLIEREIHVALERDEFALTYQPLVDVSGRTVALRGLLGWQSGWLGDVSPSVFVKVAEASTLIDRIGEWVISQACRDADRFGTAGVCVPMSTCQLKRDDVVAAVERAIAETGIDACRLILEIGGPDLSSSNADALRRLEALHALGVRISLDNFWPIFAAKDETRRLPAAMVRVGPQYVHKLGDGRTENVVVSAAAMLAGTLGLQIVAEGVDTHEQLLLARTAGCQLFIGGAIAGPLPTTQILGRLSTEVAA